jgi:NhaA family Na+:H+ antiporter
MLHCRSGRQSAARWRQPVNCLRCCGYSIKAVSVKPCPILSPRSFFGTGLLQSGVQATLAGILGALTLPAVPEYNPEWFSEHVRDLVHRFDTSHQPGKSIMTNDRLRAVVQTLDNGVHSVEAPFQRLEHVWHMPVACLVIPVFALADACIPLEFGSLGDTLTLSVMLGLSLGLVLGRFIGITGGCWLMLKLGMAVLPKDTRFSPIAGVSLLAGIGFTMSIFVARLGFGDSEEFLLLAKAGILAASLLAGVAGFICLYLVSKPVEAEHWILNRRWKSTTFF